MDLFAICSVLFAVAIGSNQAYIFDSFFQPRSGCMVLVTVPLEQYHPYYKAEIFPNVQAKIAANQNRFNRDLLQVWVDAPLPSMCGYAVVGAQRCCLNGFFESQYEFRDFESGEKKKVANEQLWTESQMKYLPFYKVYSDAPERYCKKRFGSLTDFFGR